MVIIIDESEKFFDMDRQVDLFCVIYYTHARILLMTPECINAGKRRMPIRGLRVKLESGCGSHCNPHPRNSRTLPTSNHRVQGWEGDGVKEESRHAAKRIGSCP